MFCMLSYSFINMIKFLIKLFKHFHDIVSFQLHAASYEGAEVESDINV